MKPLISFGIFVVAWVVLPVDAGATHRLLVSSFSSDQVGQFDPVSGDFLGSFGGAEGLDGVLAARLGPDGLLYVASELTNEIVRYRPETSEFVDVFVSAGPGVPLGGPAGMTWDDAGDLFVPSFNTDTILKFDGETGDYLGEAVSNADGLLNGPDNGTIFGPDGLLYVPSFFNNRILRYDLVNGTSEIFINAIVRPRVLVFEGNEIYITSENLNAVRRYTSAGAFVDNFIQPGANILARPVGLTLFNDTWYVSSSTTNKVLTFDASGAVLDANFVPAGFGGIDVPVFLTLVAVPEPTHPALFGVLLLIAGVGRMRRG